MEVAAIVRAQGDPFVDRHQNWLDYQQLKVLRAIRNCRTAALGGHVDACLGETECARMRQTVSDLAGVRVDHPGAVGSFTPKDAERRDFLEICDDRYELRSLMLTSQMPVAHWHEQIGDPTIADSILDRLVHNAYRIDLKGEPMRKKRRKPGEEEPQ